MSTAELKLHLHQLIDGITDSSVLQAVHTLLSKASEDDDWWDELPENAKNELQVAIDQLDEGKTFSHDQIKAKHRQRFPHLNL